MKNNILRLLLLFISFVSICFDGFCDDKNDSSKMDLSTNKYLDNNKSPYSKELFENINKQIFNNDREQYEVLGKQAVDILNNDVKNLEADFKGVVYSINHDFDIALSFKDLNAVRYFKPSPRNLLVNFQYDHLALETKIFKKDIGKKRKILFKYKKNKLLKLFFAMDDTQNGIFMMLPNFEEHKIQSVVMCPRVVSYINGSSYDLVNNNWKLDAVYGRGFSDVSIVINEKQPAKISAEILFSKDCKKKNIIKNNEGGLVSAKASYEQITDGDYALLTSNISKFPLLFSLASRVTYEKAKVLKEAYKRIAFEVREFELKEDMVVNLKNNHNVMVNKGPCYEIVGVKSN